MRSLTKPFFCFSLLILIISGVLLIPSLSDNAGAQSCEISICKVAEGAGDTGFPFFVEENGVPTNDFTLEDGGLCVLLAFNGAADLEITEQPVPGWQLEDVLCLNEGVLITDIENGIAAECVGPNTGGAECTFVNVPGVNENIPTLSEWGMIAAAAGLVIVGVFFAIGRKKRLQASNGSEQA